MKHHIVRSLSMLALAACAGSRGAEPPPQEPVSTTSTTSAAMPITAAAGPADTPAEIPAKVERAAPTDEDPATTAKVREHLAANPALADVDWSGVDIATTSGHVTIVGVLPTVADACEVERSAREVPGVTAVTNDSHLPEGSTQVAY